MSINLLIFVGLVMIAVGCRTRRKQRIACLPMVLFLMGGVLVLISLSHTEGPSNRPLSRPGHQAVCRP